MLSGFIEPRYSISLSMITALKCRALISTIFILAFLRVLIASLCSLGLLTPPLPPLAGLVTTTILIFLFRASFTLLMLRKSFTRSMFR